MKRMIVPGMIAAMLLVTSASRAQVSVHINIGAQPLWGPVGYDYAEYYYLPDVDLFYNVQQRQYVYLNGGRWITSPYLPDRCRNYDLYSGYKVVINEPNPWTRWNVYRTRYASYRSRPQVIIRDSHDPRYRVVPGHADYSRRDNDRYDRRPGYDNRRNDRRDNDHGRGRGNDNGHGRRY